MNYSRDLTGDARMARVNFKGAGRAEIAFSLIEMIGVLAVIAILASILFFATAKHLDIRVSDQEIEDLQNYAAAFQNCVLHNRYIPDANGWAAAIANELGVDVNTVLYNIRNKNNARAFVVDPSLTNTLTAGLPYTQPFNGNAGYPSSARVMIVSSLYTNLPSSVAAANTDAGKFATLWTNQDTQVPALSGFTGWQPNDLKIQRINLGPMFVHSILQNLSTTETVGYRSDTNAAVANLAPGATLDTYFIQTTPLQLMLASGTTNAQLILTRDESLYYVAPSWRDVPNAPPPVGTADSSDSLAAMIATAANMFGASPLNSNALAGATPSSVLNSMSNFMYDYSQYVPYATNYAASHSGNWPTTGPLYTNAVNAQSALYSAMNNLANNIVQGGCK